jgi:hypothetical protein
LVQTASGTARDRDYKSFVDSPSRGSDYSAREVFVGNQENEPVPTYQALSTNKQLFDETLTDPDVYVSVLSHTVTDLKVRILSVNLSCHVEGKAIFTVNGDTVATSRTAPSKPDCKIEYVQFLELVTGDEIEVKFKARPNSAITEVESYIHAYKIT